MVLAFITSRYMRHTKRLADDTRRMADALVKDYELRVRPILDFAVGSRMSSAEGIKVWFKFFNAGEMSVKLNQLISMWWFKNQPQAQHTIKKALGGIIPKQERPDEPIPIEFGEYEFREYDIEETKSLKGARFYEHISGIFKIEYSDTFGKLYSKEMPIKSL
jgi:hypothetical protein